MIKVLRLSLALLLAVIDPVLATTDYGVSLNILNIRLGVPSIVHGPGYDLGDGPATFIKKVDGTFNVYGSNQVTWMANARA